MKKSWLTMVVLAILIVGLTFSWAVPKAASKEHEDVSIEILGAGQGGRGYVLAHTFADVINKYGPPWLHATGRATRGGVENILMTYKDKKRRAQTLLYTPDTALFSAELGTWNFTEKITGLKLIGAVAVGSTFFVTLKPMKWSDLEGKNIATDKAGSAKANYLHDVLANAGFPVNEQKITLNQAKDALIAGMTDVISNFGVYTGKGNKISSYPAVDELIFQKKGRVYFMSIPKEIIERANKATGMGYRYLELPQEMLSDVAKEPVGGLGASVMWGVWPEMPNDVVEAIVRIYHENAEKFREYNKAGAGVDKETVGWMNFKDLEQVHPVAIKFYEEKKVKIGMPEKIKF